MKRRANYIHPLLIFIAMQIIWLSLLALWIYWYVSNYKLVQEFGAKYLPDFFQSTTRVQFFTLIFGLILFIILLAGMYFVFIFLTKQININLLYETFIANFTHELKSPLASIQLYLETMSRRKIDAKTQKEFLGRMLQDTQRLKRVIDAILDISQIEQRKKMFNRELVSVKDTFPQLIKSSQQQFKIPDENIRLKVECDGFVKIDRDAFQIVFSNLVDNAIKYSAGNLQIDIRIFKQGKNLIIEFSDHGIGIHKEDQKQIFQKFFRVSRSHLPDIRGTGLGLYHVREIIRGHEGKITVFSPGIGKGTTFTIALPLINIKDREPTFRLAKKKGLLK
ncbi:sensor histidine kinase [Caldithrix abyssi]|uniref:histidine kinase n=1 Tax=Caldithrix abyssi DSM 13497 TaxID=880073 RepID=H1XP81_CALAY|nr:HAMP domain-containing sensor histidine kinase [Caldithrix abyssi]APF18167.1 Signal transduction histidine kinase [Caldithrix abyssi DSM 13497]EHO42196.1 integral membrane sensor signal transduction histidine kinase [Caldithrix abyssi DSM 13497]